MWLPRRRHKPSSPLIPGRDRRAAQAEGRPVYSYYAGNSREGTRSMTRSVSTGQDSSAVTQRTRTSRFNRIVMLICLIVGLLCIGNILFLVPQSRIIVTGQDSNLQLPKTAYAGAADKLLRGSILNMTKITLNTNGIARELEQRFPELASVVVAVPLVGNRPAVYVSPAPPAFVLETKSGQYTIDSKGYVLAPVNGQSSLIRLRESSNRTATPGSQYLAGSIVSFAAQASYQLQKAGYSVSYLDLPAAQPYELDAYLTGKPLYIRFNLQADPLQQSGGVIATLQGLTVQPSQYLDARTPGRVYYK